MQKLTRTESTSVALLQVEGKFQVIKIQNENPVVIVTTRNEKEAEKVFDSIVKCVKEFES